jgi:hypothetical protein
MFDAIKALDGKNHSITLPYCKLLELENFAKGVAVPEV